MLWCNSRKLCCRPMRPIDMQIALGRIRSLAIAADIVRTGSTLDDEGQAEIIVLNILAVIELLAAQVDLGVDLSSSHSRH